MTLTILLLTTWLYQLWSYPAFELPDYKFHAPPSWFIAERLISI
jgi:hypothetical protein